MFAVIITEKGGAQRREEFDQTEITIGRVQGNDIILPRSNVSKRHSRLVLKDGRFIVVDLKSTNGTYVNGRKITSPLVVKPGDKIYIGDFILSLEDGSQDGKPSRELALTGPASREEAMAPPTSPPANPSPALMGAAPASTPAAAPSTSRKNAIPAAPVPSERFALDQEPDEAPPLPPAKSEPSVPNVVAGPTAAPSRLGSSEPPTRGSKVAREEPLFVAAAGDPPLRLVMSRLAIEFPVHDASASALSDHGRWSEAERAVERVVRALVAEGLVEEGPDLPALTAAAMREAVGLGAIEGLLADERVREIVVNGASTVLADHGSGLEPTGMIFSDVSMLVTVARRLVAQAGEVLDTRRAIHEVALPYGPHVTVILPPVAVRGPVIEVRRIGRGASIEQLVATGAINSEMRALLERAVQAPKNVFVVGPSGSGVTTVLGAIAQTAPKHERFVTAENVPDLFLDRPGTLSLAAGRSAGGLPFVEVIEQANRLRGDRLVVDDVSGSELARVLLVLAGRAPGNLVGVHAALDDDPLTTLRVLARMGTNASDSSLEELVARVVGVVVEVVSTQEGRRVSRIAEVSLGATGRAESKVLYTYDQGSGRSLASPSF